MEDILGVVGKYFCEKVKLEEVFRVTIGIGISELGKNLDIY
ncbi:hypothetical protein [Marinomonas balearica]|nr:hypothetical protein [Marinomonas balearica]